MKKNYISGVLIAALSVLGVQKSSAQIDSRSLLFDGNTQIVTVPDNAAYHFGSTAFSVECWIKASTSQKPYPMAISKRLSSDPTTGFGFGIDPSGKVWAQINGFNFLPGYGANLEDNTCHHIALTRTDGSTNDTLKFYADGIYLGNFVISPAYNATDTGPFYFGGDLANSANNMYAGNVSEVRLWNYARTAAEISANKGTEISGSTAGLVGYWRLNEGTGQTVTDRSTNANNGTLGNTSAVETTDPSWSTSCGVTGIENYSIDNHIKMYPNPVNSYLNVTGITCRTTISLYDVIGKLIMTTETEVNTTIDTNTLLQGIYTVVTESNKGRSFNKIIVQK